MARKVTKYESLDGQIFDSMGAAEKHERIEDIKDEYYRDPFFDKHEDPVEFEDLRAFIQRHYEMMRSLVVLLEDERGGE